MKDLVFIHGAGGNRAVWTYQSRRFSQHHRVVAVDLPGHGLSKERPRATLAEYADYVRSVISTRFLSSPIVVGHSLGGAIALRMALDTPTEVGGLVLVGTGARLRVLPDFFAALREDSDKALSLIGRYAFSPQTPKELVAKALGEMKKRGPDLLIGDFAAGDGFDVTAEINRINAPTLVIVGRDDRLTPAEYSDYLSKHIPGAQLRVIDGAGHMVMLEQPDVFNSVLEAFVENFREKVND